MTKATKTATPVKNAMAARPVLRIDTSRRPQRIGAHARIRTGDLFLTKEMLYRLSYVGTAQPKDY